MKRSVLLGLTGITLHIFLFLSTVQASSELRDMPHEGGKDHAKTAPAASVWIVLPDGTGDVPTIQDAVDASAPGDTILLGEGTFTGPGNRNVLILHDCIIRSVSGPALTMIDCEHLGPAILIGDDGDAYGSVTLAGVTVRNGGVPAPDSYYFRDACIATSWFDLTIEDCVISGSEKIAVSGDYGAVTVRRTTIEDSGSWGLVCSFGFIDASECVIRGNVGGVTGWEGGITVTRSELTMNYEWAVESGYPSDLTLENNDIVGNGSANTPDRGGVIGFDSGRCHVAGNRITDNAGRLFVFEVGLDAMVEGNVIARNEGAFLDARSSFLGAVHFNGNTIVDNALGDQPIFDLSYTLGFADRNIIAFNECRGFATADGAVMTATNNDVFFNAGFDVPDGDGNLVADPWFCGRPAGIYTLRDGSPCLPGGNPTGQLIGALGKGCEAVGPRIEVRPHTLSEHSRGIITVALSDSPEVKVRDIDPATVVLNGYVPPLTAASDSIAGVDMPPGAMRRDNSTLTLRFSRQEVLASLGPISTDGVRALSLTGTKFDGSTIFAWSDIRVVAGSKVPPAPGRSGPKSFLYAGVTGDVFMVRREDSEPVQLSPHHLEREYLKLALHSDRLLILDAGDPRSNIPSVRVIDIAERQESVLTRGQRLSYVMSMTVGKGGNIFVSARGEPGRIIRVDPDDGSQEVVYTRPGWFGPWDMIADKNGDLIIAQNDGHNAQNRGVLRIDLAKGTEEFITHDIYAPSGLALDSNGDIVVTDRTADAIMRVDHDGVTHVLSRDGFLAAPDALAADNNGDYLVSVAGRRLICVDRNDGAQTICADLDATLVDVVAIPNGKLAASTNKDVQAPALLTAAQVAKPGIATVTPNPFNPVATIRFGVVHEGLVDLVVYDVAGRLVARLAHETMSPGDHDVTWDAGGVASGVYFARLTTPDGTFTRKLVVTK